jgi:tetraacyldisaccharide-1-P 4'-kinase
MLAVGNPHGVLQAVEEGGADVGPRLLHRDHHRYRPRDIERAMTAGDDAHALLTTMKDWVKLRPLAEARRDAWRHPVVVPRLEIAFIEGEDAVLDLVRRALTNPSSPTG